jgi:hypothetical protein
VILEVTEPVHPENQPFCLEFQLLHRAIRADTGLEGP